MPGPQRAGSESIADDLRTFFAADPHGAICVYLFGSVARGTDRSTSDVDVGVLFAAEPEPTLDGLPLELEYELELKLGRQVQVVALNTAPADLVHRVLRDGILVLERDDVARVRWEVRRRNEFFDLQPILRDYRQPYWRSRDAS